MFQVVQDVKSGETKLEQVPPPALQPGFVLVRTAASLISAGTERMVIDLAKKSYLGKAQARPDLAKQVIQKAQKEGLVNTWRNVQSKLTRPLPLGYSAAGIVEAVGEGVSEFAVGDRVAMAGAGYANHAEVCAVPKNLVARIPDGVPFEDACYATVAAIGLQGVRLAKPELGDNVVVLGLGLIGLITVQLCKAAGCRVLGVDLDPQKAALARQLGADDAVTDGAEAALEKLTGGRGADHVLITAATKSSGPITAAGHFARHKGRVVAVGAIGMDVPRDLYYKKELELHISMSYGPGRYDPAYEEGGHDYPYAYVRWTEGRNLEAVLNLMAEGKLDVATLTTHRFPIADALGAYGLIETGGEPYVGLVLQYDVDQPVAQTVRLDGPQHVAAAHVAMAGPVKGRLGVGFVGAGNYAALHLLPHLQKHEHAALTGLVTATGPSAKQQGETFGFGFAGTDLQALLDDGATDAVFIATRHATHAPFAAQALRAGRHVFVEKPLAATEDGLADVVAAYREANAKRPTGLMVGLNRRFAPMVQRLYAAFQGTGPKQMLYRVNSGAITTNTWLHRPEEGGGMLVGEACHFLDLMRHFAGARAVSVYAQSLALNTESLADDDNVTVTVTYADGSVGVLAYSTVGDKAMPKERLEIYGGGQVGVLDDFRRLEISANGKKESKKASNQDKGQANQVAATVEAFRRAGQGPIPFEELVEAMSVVFAARRSLRSGQPERVEGWRNGRLED